LAVVHTVALFFIGSVYREVKQSFIDMEAMFHLRDTAPSMVDSITAVPYDPITMGTTITLDNVHYAYPITSTTSVADGDAPSNDKTKSSVITALQQPLPQRQGRPILQGTTLDIPHGQTVAIVGSSGCGKSTILRLLYRFFDPHQGHVSIGGRPVTDWTRESVQRAMAVVPQDVILFHETIGYNIQYGNLNASWDDVVAAAQKAKIHDTILSFPDGYNTIVGERGLKLSGGEKQRVRISVLYRNDGSARCNNLGVHVVLEFVVASLMNCNSFA
jgi:ATP-binding cassette, subfamily B (MDR/TAP), member 7